MLKYISSFCISKHVIFSKRIFIAVFFFFSLFNFLSSQTITYDTWEKFSIASQMPAEVHLQNSNNNLDLVKFKNRFYVAFRTAPTHFASPKTTLYVVSSTDYKKWEFEYELNVQADIREPRFAIWNDSLYLYCFKGGTKKFRFEPQELLVTSTSEGKSWIPASSVQLDGYVPWRLRIHNNELLLSAYYGKDLYNNKHQSDLRLFKSTDARHFKPISKEPQINVKTAEEGEFIFDSTGTLYAVVRLEGYGALVCKADKDSIDKWHFVKTKHKYDSSLLFEHKNDIYLIARRNLDGPCDRSAEGHKPHRAYNLVRYSLTKKRTALYKLDKATLSFTSVLDFPSTGDCSFAGIQKLTDTDYLIMNYSNDISHKEKIWLRGQFGKTYLYQSVLHIK
jgi:hypothetical protein